MSDMEELISEAKKRDMYILMDLVVNHCSNQHKWFKKALADTKKYDFLNFISMCRIASINFHKNNAADLSDALSSPTYGGHYALQFEWWL